MVRDSQTVAQTEMAWFSPHSPHSGGFYGFEPTGNPPKSHTVSTRLTSGQPGRRSVGTYAVYHTRQPAVALLSLLALNGEVSRRKPDEARANLVTLAAGHTYRNETPSQVAQAILNRRRVDDD